MTATAEVPERLRLRVVALVSAVLPSVTPVPAPLRKVAGFAPARRARLGGTAIWDALALPTMTSAGTLRPRWPRCPALTTRWTPRRGPG